ncbi:substrate-binding domain-containing protein [Aliihoeflea aestuarii]|jgi:LacI family transcriptional regulator, gluconate utilization system Gnt-I transcriptional repressor|uniref:LacI family DNA-binding transcriptional regulator n=1 Tax=Aliihoeflea aestuarii TaxID=453840 RepID=UPI0020937897|nr:LacI family DNA-binding transcriptional regulator [Aliihoeflea aestuarii]MCO6390832.1 substrate-binding domain-containing protein [Aliihoeflea aestuarii]
MTIGSPPFAATLDPVLRVGTRIEQTGASSKKRVRIEEVARLAGVSPITVSRALHSPHMVSEARRLRIDEAVTQTGYASNPHARALKSGRSNIVAAFLSTLASQQYTQAADGCARVLEDAGYHMVMGRTFYSYARETPLIHAIMDMRPAAAFITGVMELEENRSFLRNLKIPIVESWANASDPIDMLAGFSNVDGVTLVIDHLAARGYRRLGFLGRNSGRGQIRQNAFEQLAAQRGLEIAGTLSVPNVAGIADGRRAFRRLIESASGIEAVFCANDLLGIGAMLEARTMGLTMPGDIAIVGFGDSDVASEVPPGMTTVSVDAYALGAAAGEMILTRLSGDLPDAPSRIFPVTLIQRGSS